VNCPECINGRLRTVETFQTQDTTIRTKLCTECRWKFTTVERVEDDLIPSHIRLSKRRKKEK